MYRAYSKEITKIVIKSFLYYRQQSDHQKLHSVNDLPVLRTNHILKLDEVLVQYCKENVYQLIINQHTAFQLDFLFWMVETRNAVEVLIETLGSFEQSFVYHLDVTFFAE